MYREAVGRGHANPAGNVSVNATPVSETDALAFVMVKLREVEFASPMEAAPNDLLIEGA